MTGQAPVAAPATSPAAAPPSAPAAGPGLSEKMRRIIRGEATEEEKAKAYDGSLQRWWKEYAGRKNEEEDMVADSLLYDERCHLPRTTAGPKPAFSGNDAEQPAGGAAANGAAASHHANGAANGGAGSTTA